MRARLLFASRFLIFACLLFLVLLFSSSSPSSSSRSSYSRPVSSSSDNPSYNPTFIHHPHPPCALTLSLPQTHGSNCGAFTLSTTTGTLQPFELKTIQVVFTPRSEGNVSKVLLVTVEDQAPFFVDLIAAVQGAGTASPVFPITAARLHVSKLLASRGVNIHSPQSIADKVKSGEIPVDEVSSVLVSISLGRTCTCPVGGALSLSLSVS
jgi:hypothetical protein